MGQDDIAQKAQGWPDTFDARRWGPGQRGRRHRLLVWSVAGLTGLAVFLVGAPALYFAVQGNGPKPLTLPVGPGGAVGPVNGTWTVVPPSQVQYRVEETLVGQHHVAVGTTSDVSGTLVIKGATVVRAQFTVKMASVKSDMAGRNDQFNGAIMDTLKYPDGYFTLTKPVDLGKVPAKAHTVTVNAVGDLTLRGKSRQVTFPLHAERFGDGIDANGSLTIKFGLWGIPNPSFAVARVGSTGTVDVLFHLVRKGS